MIGGHGGLAGREPAALQYRADRLLVVLLLRLRPFLLPADRFASALHADVQRSRESAHRAIPSPASFCR